MRLPLLFFLAFAAPALPSLSAGAGFDCGKAATNVEQTICADVQLSGLDEKLARTYRDAVSNATNPDDIQKAQRAWLRDQRNTCATRECLARAYQTRIDELTSRGSGATGAKACPIREKDLVGSWKNISQAGFFEEMSFGYSGSHREFNSWLHQRPEFAGGTWELDNCVLHIRHPSEENLSVSFTVVNRKGERIYLREAGERDIAVYRRVGK